jgi:hypothetical protein
MKLTLLILALATCLVSAQLQDQVVTNQTVAGMVKAGVARDLIIDTINKSDCRFQLDAGGLIWLRKAEVPDEIVRVMAARAAARPSPPSQSPTSTSPAPSTAQRTYYSPEPPVERVTNVGAETKDWDFELGTVALQFGGGLSAGPNRLTRTVSPAISGELNIGMNRHLSLIGGYAYHTLGTADFLSCSGYSCVLLPIKLRAHEMTGGVKVTIPTSTRFTPFFTGSAGAIRAAAGTSVLGIGVSASDSAFIGGGGGGFRVNLTRRLALDYDVRLFVGQYGIFYGRTTLGLQVRLN